MNKYFLSRLLLILIYLIATLNSNAQPHGTPGDSTDLTCHSALSVMQEVLFMSCPVSEGVDEVHIFLRQLPSYELFLQNESYSYGHTIFKSRNATFLGRKIVDDSWLAVQYKMDEEYRRIIMQFSAEYLFEEMEHRDEALSHLTLTLDNLLSLKKIETFNTRQEPYIRYNMPCGSWIILKKGTRKEAYTIRVDWNPFVPEENLPPVIPAEKLLSAPETISVENIRLYLNTHMSMDFMPTYPNMGPRSYTTLLIQSTDPAPLPATISVDAVWVVRKGKVWSSWLPEGERDPPDQKPNVIYKRIKKGPGGEEKELMDVIVRVIDGKGNAHLLKARNQSVRYTY